MFIDIHAKYPLFSSDFNKNLNFLDRFSENTQISNFMKIRPVEAELFHANGQMDRHDEANSRFFRNFEKTLKKEKNLVPLPRLERVFGCKLRSPVTVSATNTMDLNSTKTRL